MAGKNSIFVDNSAPSVDATWLNLQQDEGNNVILGSGQTLSDAIDNQRVIGVSRFAANNFYIDSGSANTYVLTLAASMTNPVSSTVGYFVGMTIRFRAGNANTGASIANVNSAGVKNLKKEDGTTDLEAGDISTLRDSIFRYDGTVFRLVINALEATTSTSGTTLLPQPITIANNTTDTDHDIDFSTGNFEFDDGSGIARLNAMTKRLDANWAAGTNQGGLDTGTKANSTWYHCYAIYNPTTNVSDALFSTSATSPTLPSGYTKKAWRMAFYVNSSGNIDAFKQDGKTITYQNVQVYNNTSVPITFVPFTARTPTGIRVKALLFGIIDPGSNQAGMWLGDRITGFEKAVIYGPLDNTGSSFWQYTDLSSQINVRKDTTANMDDFFINSYGWEIPDNLY